MSDRYVGILPCLRCETDFPCYNNSYYCSDDCKRLAHNKRRRDRHKARMATDPTYAARHRKRSRDSVSKMRVDNPSYWKAPDPFEIY